MDGWKEGRFKPASHNKPKLFSLPLYVFPPPPRNLLSRPQVTVVHLSMHRGKWLRPALPAMLVYSADLQADGKDDRTGLFWADP